MDWVNAVLWIGVAVCFWLMMSIYGWLFLNITPTIGGKQYSFKYACTFTAVTFLGTSVLAGALIIIIKG